MFPSILDILVLAPLVAILSLSVLKGDDKKWITVLSTVYSLFIMGLAYYAFRQSTSSSTIWLTMEHPQINIMWALSLKDGLSGSLVLLTALLVPISIMVSFNSVTKNLKTFYCAIFFLEAGMFGTFMATDLFTFYICWESVLAPMLLMIGIWGSSNRRYASVKLFLFTMLGSLPMLAALLAISWNESSQEFITNMQDLKALAHSKALLGESLAAPWAFWCIAIAFAIKLPLVPLHTWLPDAHTEAPTAGSVILAGVMLKMGTYGFLRIALPFFPGVAFADAYEFLGWVACIGIIWGAMMALAQTDIKRLIAYSSVSHLGTCMLGIFALSQMGITGGQMQMINHGISTGLLFLIFGMLYERGHVRDISAYGGLAKKMPILTVCFFIATLSSIAAPGTNGFIGEFLILNAAFQANPAWGVIASLGVILGAVYMLRLFRLVFLGKLKMPEGSEEQMKDLNAREVALLLPLLVLVFLLGIKPDLLMNSLNIVSRQLHGLVDVVKP
jgi:NADH-quinone oxidoreductase subunit M